MLQRWKLILVGVVGVVLGGLAHQILASGSHGVRDTRRVDSAAASGPLLPVSSRSNEPVSPELAEMVRDEIMEGARGTLGNCAREFRAREYQRRVQRTTSIRSTIHLRVSAEDGVAEVAAAPPKVWPAEADQALQACVLRAFGRVKFPAYEPYDVELSYPLCIRGDDPVEGESGS